MNKKNLKLSGIFMASAIFFSIFSFFGTYKYTIYSPFWFMFFFVYELVFYLGLKTKNTNNLNVKKQSTSYYLSSFGEKLLWIIGILSICSFVYFIYLYNVTQGKIIFGKYTADVFEEGRTSLEKITLLLMQIGGDSAYLIVSADDTKKHKNLERLLTVTLFLPGIRYLLMGSRFTIAVEFLMMVAIKWPAIKNKISFSQRAKWQKRVIVISAIVIGILFCYLFSSRTIYYNALERRAFFSGDMILKPFWKSIYERTNGKIDFICTASDYLGESPYIFSYYCKYHMPQKKLYGQLLFRSIVQIISNLTGGGGRYAEIRQVFASGQYSGFAYNLIADFGVVGSIFATFFIGKIFGLIEKKRYENRICKTIYPAITVICFFSPIFYFYVGRIDYAILFAVVLSLICIKRKNIASSNTNSIVLESEITK